MVSCIYLQYFPHITFIIFLAAPLSEAENANYAACSIPYSCGHIQNVGYPFWGGNRPKYCGIAHLKLNCDSNSTSFDVGVTRNMSFDLQVLSINTSSHLVVLDQENLLNICLLRHTGYVPLLSKFKHNTNFVEIQILYSCDKCIAQHNLKIFNYSKLDGTKDDAYYSDKPSDVEEIGKSCHCRNNLTILVDKRALAELRNSDTNFTTAIKKFPNVSFEYKNSPTCYKCEESGGRCGSLEDLLSDQFVCYCQDGPHQRELCPKSEKTFILILGLVVAGALLVATVISTFWNRKKLKSIRLCDTVDCCESELVKTSIYFGVPLFCNKELAEATDNFDQSNELGSGGFGTVYHGILKDGREVAVKRLHERSYKRVERFMNEVQILTRLRHQNLVSLYGCTSLHSKEQLLVYEYVKNGTLADHLYGRKAQSGPLIWPVRMKIAIETANALSYLHGSNVLHCDVKTSNILLDSNFGVKVVDFGLSRLFPTDATHVSTAPQGTPGYLDPDYHQCYQLTDKSDVYSFGVVLLELISALPAVSTDRCRDEINLSKYAMTRIQQGTFDDLVDPKLGFELDFKVRRMTTLVAEVAFQCLQHDKEFRPSMDEVLEALKRISGVDYEALLEEETAKNAVLENDEALQAEEMDNSEADMLNILAVAPPSPVEDDNIQLLSNNHENSSSPVSVMDQWVSTSTTPSSSK